MSRNPGKISGFNWMLLAVLVGGIAGSPAFASEQVAPQAEAGVLAAEVLATLEVVAAHCPQIRVNEDVRNRIVEAAGQDEAALREDEAYFRQMLKLNPLIENYDHETGCGMLSRSHDGDVPGLLSIE